MNRLRETQFVQFFLVVVVVLFVCGVGMPGGVFARVDMQNGHEGDPEDGMEIVGGGSGDPDDGFDIVGGGAMSGSGLPLGVKCVFGQNSVLGGVVVEFVIDSDLQLSETCLPASMFLDRWTCLLIK